MIRNLLTALALMLALFAADPSGQLTGAAHAQSCLSQGDARQAVASGQAVPLSGLLGQIRAAVGGDILPSPQLCNVGGRLVYVVNVISNGQVTRVQVDAKSGRVNF